MPLTPQTRRRLAEFGLIYAAAVWLSFHLLVLIDEEPTLSAKFGASYDSFRANVPRWLPRITPWHSRPN